MKMTNEESTVTREDLRLAILLHRFDPVGLAAYGAPEDEYLPEARTIARRLTTASSEVDVHVIVFEEFFFWFEEDAGPSEHYREIASAIWESMQEMGVRKGAF